jgi:hypothetical protein
MSYGLRATDKTYCAIKLPNTEICGNSSRQRQDGGIWGTGIFICMYKISLRSFVFLGCHEGLDKADLPSHFANVSVADASFLGPLHSFVPSEVERLLSLLVWYLAATFCAGRLCNRSLQPEVHWRNNDLTVIMSDLWMFSATWRRNNRRRASH